MSIKILFIILLMLPVPFIRAQETGFSKADQMFDYFKAGQGDSLFLHSDEAVRQQLTAEIYSGLYNQLQTQLGNLVNTGGWSVEPHGENLVYKRSLHFDHMRLIFSLTLNKDEKISGIFVFPDTKATQTYTLVHNDTITEEAIEIVTGEFKLPGILTLPVAVKNPPVAILVHGSGSHDRDETIGPNKPFRDLAWGLAERGVAVIRYDKRPYVYGASYAPPGEDNLDHEAVDDALSAIQIAKDHQELANSKVFIIGHSIGAMVAPRIARRSSDLSGIIMIAGNARPLDDLVLEQFEYLLAFPSSGLKPEDVEVVREQVINARKYGTAEYDASIAFPLDMNESYWKSLHDYNQLEVAGQLKLPIFVIQGERDYQVTMEDFNIWKSALKKNKKAVFKSYPQLNHLLLEGEGKSTPDEYQVAKNIPAYIMVDIANWIKSH